MIPFVLILLGIGTLGYSLFTSCALFSDEGCSLGALIIPLTAIGTGVFFGLFYARSIFHFDFAGGKAYKRRVWLFNCFTGGTGEPVDLATVKRVKCVEEGGAGDAHADALARRATLNAEEADEEALVDGRAAGRGAAAGGRARAPKWILLVELRGGAIPWKMHVPNSKAGAKTVKRLRASFVAARNSARSAGKPRGPRIEFEAGPGDDSDDEELALPVLYDGDSDDEEVPESLRVEVVKRNPAESLELRALEDELMNEPPPPDPGIKEFPPNWGADLFPDLIRPSDPDEDSEASGSTDRGDAPDLPPRDHAPLADVDAPEGAPPPPPEGSAPDPPPPEEDKKKKKKRRKSKSRKSTSKGEDDADDAIKSIILGGGSAATIPAGGDALDAALATVGEAKKESPAGILTRQDSSASMASSGSKGSSGSGGSGGKKKRRKSKGRRKSSVSKKGGDEPPEGDFVVIPTGKKQ